MDDELSKKIEEILLNQKAIIERLNNLETYTVSNLYQLKTDLLFQTYQNFHTLQQGIYAISRKIKSAKNPKVVFLIHHLQAFYNIEDVYLAFKSSEQVDTMLIVINNHFKDPMVASGASETSSELNRRGIEHISFDMENSYYALDIVLALNPDYIFIQSPWDNDRPLALKVPYLMFSKIVYIPYYPITLLDHFKPEGDDFHFNSYVHNLAYRIYIQTELDKKYFEHHQIIKGSNIKVVGSTKLLKLKNLRERNTTTFSDKFTLIWAPHHSIAQRWLGFGVFHRIYKDMTSLAKERKDIKIVYKPHPFLRRSLAEHEIMHKTDYDEWLKEFSTLENVEVYEGGDYFNVFSRSDVMLTDGLSFLIEYPIATAKPLIFFDSKTHQPLNQIGQKALEYAYIVDSFDGFLKTLDNLILLKAKNQIDSMYVKRMEVLNYLENNLIPSKDPSQVILEDLLQDYKS